MHDGIVEPFEGGYAAYVLARVERDRQASTIAAKRANLMKKELAWLRRGAPARTAKPKFRIEAANALIADEPPVRDTVALTRMATSRLGRDVVELVEAGVSYDGSFNVLHDISWHLGPGDRVGILGANGAGKSTLLGLVTGDVEPTSGKVKRGKTVKSAWLSQDLHELTEHANQRITDVIAPYRVAFTSASGDELTPGQILERLGFSGAHLATPVKDLSGGQKRRLQLVLVLLSEPNVLVLDEPTNDMDTDMLAAMEDLLDGWPGTLLVVSHDRYLLERVTDNQYAVMGGALRHLPGGVDEYLALRAKEPAASRDVSAGSRESSAGGDGASGGGSGAERHAARKELASVERKMEKRSADAAALHAKMATHDVSDYAGLEALAAQVREIEAEITQLEERWMELASAD